MPSPSRWTVALLTWSPLSILFLSGLVAISLTFCSGIPTHPGLPASSVDATPV